VRTGCVAYADDSLMIMLSVDLDGYACGRSLAWHQPSLGDSSVRPWSRWAGGRGRGQIRACSSAGASGAQHADVQRQWAPALIHEIICGVCLQRDRRVSGLRLGCACTIKRWPGVVLPAGTLSYRRRSRDDLAGAGFASLRRRVVKTAGHLRQHRCSAAVAVSVALSRGVAMRHALTGPDGL
jgi:hypothetical protein